MLKPEPQIQRTIPLSADVKQRIVSLDASHVLQPYSELFLTQELKMLPRFLSEIPRLVMIRNNCLKPTYTTIKFSNHVTKVLKSLHSFECVFTHMYLGEIQTVNWGTFTFTLPASKRPFFLQCSFNS